MPPRRGRARAARRAPQRTREPLTPEEEELVRDDGHPPRRATPSCSTSRRASRRRAGPRPPSISTACSTGSPTTSAAGPSWSTGSTRTRRGRCWSRASARAAGHFAKAFSGRTARKVYWALVVGVPSPEEGMIDAPLAKQPGTGGEKMHVDEENGLPRQDPLPDHRPRRQPRRLGRAAAADRPHPPAARAHGGDRPPDRRRRQIWRGRGVPDRRDQPQAPPPRAAAPDRRARAAARSTSPPSCRRISPKAWRCSGSSRWPGDMLPLDTPDPAERPRPSSARSAAAAKTRRRERQRRAAVARGPARQPKRGKRR